MLTNRELTSMRAECNKWMPDTAAVYMYAGVDDGMGGTTQTLTPVMQADSVSVTTPCRVLTPKRLPSEETRADKPTTVTQVDIELPYDVVAAIGFILKVGAISYKVMDVDLGHSEAMQIVARCEVIS